MILEKVFDEKVFVLNHGLLMLQDVFIRLLIAYESPDYDQKFYCLLAVAFGDNFSFSHISNSGQRLVIHKNKNIKTRATSSIFFFL